MLIRINPDKINSADLFKAADILQNDGVIVYPTDSVYALGCSSQSPRAVEKLCRLQNTTPEKINLSLICADMSQLSFYTKPLNNAVFRVMKKALPGPYTFILQASNNVPKIFIKQNKKTIGIRIPANEICKALVNTLGFPLLTTSLYNEEDEITEYHTDPDVIYEQYNDKVDAVIDGGFGNIYPTTVLNCTDDECEVIREGLGMLDVLN